MALCKGYLLTSITQERSPYTLEHITRTSDLYLHTFISLKCIHVLESHHVMNREGLVLG